MSDSGAAFVLDIGTLLTRVGFHTQPEPEEVILSLVAIPKSRTNVGMSDASKSVYFGSEANRHRAVCKIYSPMDAGMVTDWDRMTQLLEYCYTIGGVEDSTQHPVIMIDSYNTPKEHRAKFASILFERFRIPGLYFAAGGVAGLLSTGRTTGFVLESGEMHTIAMTILDGIVLPHATRKNEICGSNVTHFLTTLLSSHYIQNARDSVREMKEKFAFVSSDFVTETAKCRENPSAYMQIFTLPDGQFIELSSQCFGCAEPLFAPERQYGTNHNYEGFATTTVQALSGCPPDVVPYMRNNLVLVGGNTTIRGFSARLDAELNALTGETFRIDGQKPQRKGCTRNWRGAAILGSLSSMKQLYWTKADCEENGYEVVSAHSFMDGI